MLLNWCIVTVLSVVEESYADLNNNSRILSLDEVNKLMEKHCSTGELLNTSSSTF
ncbi:hypothetical protein J6590_105047, partial [Homalodisca vitripennis]